MVVKPKKRATTRINRTSSVSCSPDKKKYSIGARNACDCAASYKTSYRVS